MKKIVALLLMISVSALYCSRSGDVKNTQFYKSFQQYLIDVNRVVNEIISLEMMAPKVKDRSATPIIMSNLETLSKAGMTSLVELRKTSKPDRENVSSKLQPQANDIIYNINNLLNNRSVYFNDIDYLKIKSKLGEAKTNIQNLLMANIS